MQMYEKYNVRVDSDASPRSLLCRMGTAEDLSLAASIRGVFTAELE